ncbi:RESPIRATORY COMPLEX I CHAPERONE (CIA84) putative [Salix viminalis]|uniref:RESPIRATORY COMPLEX I CHAPERONE (CIA84) putative n=1 Tax=Salix viminalis TaxID=40686 RepID=A0A9Q0UVW4_SALVM|nr:RESPIRATORY COMPLEX I CHAPERONE (CIA84) putative [Salix viminalis]
MLDIFGEAGRIESMKYVFKKMQEMGLKIDVVTYTSILNWVSKSGDVDGAVEIWKEMRENRCFPTVVSYTAYLKVLLDNKRVKEGIGVYKEMLESGDFSKLSYVYCFNGASSCFWQIPRNP